MKKKEVKQIDRMLVVAHKILKDETCSSCGTVAWHGRTFNENVTFKMNSSVCHACAYKETDDKQRGHKEKPGETRYVSTIFVGDPPTRKDWQKELMEEFASDKQQ